MKKIITLATVGVLSASMLCGCGKSSSSKSSILPLPVPQSRSTGSEQNVQDEQSGEVKSEVKITINGEAIEEFMKKTAIRPPFSGVRRRFIPDRSGTYTIEYVHVPYGIERDDTLDYSITLNDDNTFTMNVTSGGVSSAHSGHWYTRRDSITMFYDEKIDPTAHNVYVADSMYGELLPNGKIMIYDNCHTIVLSRTPIDTDMQLYDK